MERREHYDPEDIEQLLLERSFDELLEEERAYVLRHLSGRDEYEAMRRLLMEVQGSEPDHELLDADPGVRANVMQAFRDRHKPQWRVWLNSVGASLLPGDASAMWRPALALAGLALLITAGIWFLDSGNGHAEVAEVREERARPDEAPTKQEDMAPVAAEGLPDTEQAHSAPEQPVAQKALEDAAPYEEPLADALGKDQQVASIAADDATERKLIEAETVTGEELAAGTGASSSVRSIQADSLMLFSTAPAATNSGYLDNWSLANAQGAVTREAVVASKPARAKKEKYAKDDSRAVSQDTEVLALLRAAW